MPKWLTSKLFLSIALFLFIFALYSSLTPPTNPNFADSDELITAAKVLGVPHPPGYPLYTLLASFFGALPLNLPFAGKINLLSSLLQSLSVVIFFLTASLVSSTLLSFLASLVLAFSFGYFFNGILAEVFPLNNLLTALIIYLLFLWQKFYLKKPKVEKKLLFLASLLFGLGVSNQQTIILLFPAFAFWVISHNSKLIKNWKFLLQCFGLFLIGFLLPYIYVPIAASRQPFINWENATTFDKIIRLITRRAYADVSPTHSSYLYFSQIDLANLQIQLWSFFDYLREQFGWAFLIIGGLGFWPLLKTKKFKLLIFLILGLIGSGLFFALYDPINYSFVGHDDFTLVYLIMRRFYTFSLYFYSLAIIFGLITLSRQKLFQPWIILIIAYLILNQGISNYLSVKSNNFSLAHDYSTRFINSLEKDSILICFTAEDGCFSAYYLQNVEGQRKDIIIIPADFNQRTKQQLFAQAGEELFKTTSTDQVVRIRDILRTNINKRPIYMMGLNTKKIWLFFLNVEGNPFYFQPSGCGLYKVTKSYSKNPTPDPCADIEARVLDTPESSLNFYRAIYSQYFGYVHYINAQIYETHNCFNDSSDELQRAINIFPNYQNARQNLARIQKKAPDSLQCPANSSEHTVDEMVKLSQDFEQKYQNSSSKDDLDSAISYAFQATMLDPNRLDLRLKLAELTAKARYFLPTELEYKDILNIDPNNPIAKDGLKSLGVIK